MTNEKEIFVDVEGFDGYKIGNLGILLGRQGKPMKPSLCKDDYLQANLMIGTKALRKLIHRLIAEHFVHKPE